MDDIQRLDYSIPPPVGSARGGLARAWRFYKENHNPPGMWTGFSDRWPDDLEHCRPKFGVGLWKFPKLPKAPYKDWQRVAREAAWAHYDRRLALARRCGRAQREWEHWPRALCWTDDACTEIEVWLANGGPLPEALRA